MSARSLRTGTSAVGILLGAAILLGVNYLAARHWARADWTRARIYSLSEQTKKILAGLKERGMNVTVLHLMPTLMERQLDPAAGHLLQRAVEARGIRVITGANTKAILGEKKVEAVLLEDGTRVPADLVVMARPHLKDPYLTLHAAEQYGHYDQFWPPQYGSVRPRRPR